MSASAQDPLDLESQVVVSHPTWIIGTGLGSTARTVCASPAPGFCLLKTLNCLASF